MFENVADEFIVAKVRENFEFITGERLPVEKGKSKNDAAITPRQWFEQLSFLHFMIFRGAFAEAKKRGVLNVVEVALCEEVLAIVESEG